MNENNDQPVLYLSFLLRLWRTGEDNPWKASLEDPRTGERMGFQSLELLQAYLREQTQVSIDLAPQYDKPSQY